MKQSVKRLLSSVLALLLLVVAFVVFLNFVQPRYTEVSQLKGQVLSQSDLVQREDTVIKEVQKLDNVYNQSQDLRDSVSNALPEAPQVAEALTQINGLAGLNRLTAQAYTLSAPAPVLSEAARRSPDRPGAQSLIQQVNFMVFQVKLVGSYSDFKNFLHGLEHNLRVMDVRSLTIQSAAAPVPGKNPQDLFEYDLAVVTYYQVSQAEVK